MTDLHIERDRWGRPLIKLPDSDEVVPYRRASSYGKALDDTSGLTLWKQRLTAQAVAEHSHLQIKIAAAKGDKRKLNKICEEALELAGASRKSEIGTSLHELTEFVDSGASLPFVPNEYRADLKAYQRATKDFYWLEIEQFVVQDELRAAGTPDRIAGFEGENYIADIKTGGVGFPHGFAVQLAIYAHSKGYDAATKERRDLPAVNKERGILIHLPSGEGKAELHWLDISKGFEAARLAADVDAWRKTKNLTTPFQTEDTAA